MSFFTHNAAPIVGLSINLLTAISYFVLHANEKRKTAFFRLPLLIQKGYVALFVAPLFVSPFLPQSHFSAPHAFFVVTGILLTSLGLLFILLSFFKIGLIPSMKSSGGISTNGVYGIVRHPIYSGTVITEIGLTLGNQSLITLIYIPISVLLYFLMALIEEKELILHFSDEYSKYQQKVKYKLIPYIV